MGREKEEESVRKNETKGRKGNGDEKQKRWKTKSRRGGEEAE